MFTITNVKIACNRANNRLKALSNEELKEVWAALNTSAAWSDNRYNDFLSLDGWADMVYSEMTERNLPAP